LEPLSILNPPFTDILNDPRLTSADLLKLIDEQQGTITGQIGELAKTVRKEDTTPFEGIIFALLQHHLHVTTLNTKLTARTTDLVSGTFQLNFRLERLTKWLIALTVVLGMFTVPLAIDAILKWLR